MLQGLHQRVLGRSARSLALLVAAALTNPGIADQPAEFGKPPASSPATPAQTPAQDTPAETPPEAPAEPVVTNPTVVAPPRIIIAPVNAPALEPIRPNVPPSAMSDLDLVSNPMLMREGAFVGAARAQVVQGRSGRWYAIFDQDAAGRMIPPMILMPSPYLKPIEQAAEREPAGTRFRLTGRVTVYRNRNFLLPTAPPLLERSVTAPASTLGSSNAPSPAVSTPPAAEAAAQASRTTPSGEPSIEKIIADLDRVAGPTRTMPTARTPDAPQAVANAPAALEPTAVAGSIGFLTQRRGRVVRTPDGTPMVVLDSGAFNTTELPLILLPCQNLTLIESFVDSGGEAATFTFTGEVHTHGGERFFLPTMFSPIRTSDNIMPAQ